MGSVESQVLFRMVLILVSQSQPKKNNILTGGCSHHHLTMRWYYSIKAMLSISFSPHTHSIGGCNHTVKISRHHTEIICRLRSAVAFKKASGQDCTFEWTTAFSGHSAFQVWWLGVLHQKLTFCEVLAVTQTASGSHNDCWLTGLTKVLHSRSLGSEDIHWFLQHENAGSSSDLSFWNAAEIFWHPIHAATWWPLVDYSLVIVLTSTSIRHKPYNDGALPSCFHPPNVAQSNFGAHRCATVLLKVLSEALILL